MDAMLQHDSKTNGKTADVNQDARSLNDDIRSRIVLVGQSRDYQHEIASYVSDDFDLIVRGSVLGVNDDFLNRLWDAYNRNEIPTPHVGK